MKQTNKHYTVHPDNHSYVSSTGMFSVSTTSDILASSILWNPNAYLCLMKIFNTPQDNLPLSGNLGRWRCDSTYKFHPQGWNTVYPKKYAHGFVVLCFVVVMKSFIMNSHEVFIHIHQGCFAGTGAIVRLPQCQWSKPDGYGKISQCITTTKHSKAKTVCLFLGIYCTLAYLWLIYDLIYIQLLTPLLRA